MVDKGMLRITDLPTAAQAKLFARKDQRAKAALRMESRFTASGFVELIDDSAFGKLSDTDLGTF